MAKKGNPHILVIRLSAMGDVAMTVPVLLALKVKYPEARITLLTKPHLVPIFNSVKGVKIITAEVKSKHKGLKGLWKLYKGLKPSRITHVADLHNVLRSRIIGLFFKSTGIPVKKLGKGRVEKRRLTRGKNKKFQPLKPTIERYSDVFHALGFSINMDKKYFLPKEKNPRDKINIGIASKRIGIAPFAAHKSKMYRLDLMEQVIRKILDQTDGSIFLFGGGQFEEEQLTILESKFDSGVRSLVGKLSFEEELAFISNLDVMLAMDSGNGHLAANYEVPVITIWGVTHPYAGFAPYDQPFENSLIPDRTLYPLIPTSVYGNSYPKNYLEAINSISPDTVVQKVLKVLN